MSSNPDLVIASKTAKLEDFLDQVEEATRGGKLVPSQDIREGIIRSFVTSHRSPDVLIGQAHLAKEQGRDEWLRVVAHEARVLQFHSDDWLAKNFSQTFVQRKRTPQTSPRKPSRDFRLDEDPSIESRLEVITTSDREDTLSLGSTGEHQLLMSEADSPGKSSQSSEKKKEDPMEVDPPVSPAPSDSVVLGASGSSAKSEEPPVPGTPKKTWSPVKGPSPVQTSQTDAPKDKVVVPAKQDQPPKKPEGKPRRESSRRSRSPKHRSAMDQRSKSGPHERPHKRDSSRERRPRERSRERRHLEQRSSDRGHGRRSPQSRKDRGRRDQVVSPSKHRDSKVETRPRRDRDLTVGTRPSGKQPAEFRRPREGPGSSHGRERAPPTDLRAKLSAKQTTSPQKQVRRKDRSSSQRTQSTAPPQKKIRKDRSSSQRTQSTSNRPSGSSLPTCPVPGCQSSPADLRKHAMESHIPATFNESLDVDEVSCRRLSALKLVAIWLLGARATVQDLARYVSSMELLPTRSKITDIQTTAMNALCVEMGVQPPKSFSLQPVSSPAVLIHWRALLLLVAQLEPRHRSSLLEQFQDSVKEPATTEDTKMEEDGLLPEAIDSHFHLDRCRTILKRPTATFKEICQAIPPLKADAVQLVGAVTNFCDPKTYPTEAEVRDLHSQGVTVSIGLHPKGIQKTTDDDFAAMKRLLQMPEVVGFGEVGLDHSVPPNQWMKQQDFLSKALDLLLERHVLVLHCRGMPGKDSSEVYSCLLHQLKNKVDKNQAIHLHCFNGNQEVVQNWLGVFPRTYFGFTRLVDSFHEDNLQGLMAVGDKRLLLETDAPYFQFREIPGRFPQSCPGLIGMTARKVAAKRGASVADVLRVATENARILYQRPEAGAGVSQ